MSKTKTSQTADRAGDLYETARENPYVQRLIEDDELRDNLTRRFRRRPGRLRPRDRQRQGHGQGRDLRQEGAEGNAQGRREPAGGLRASAGAEEAQGPPRQMILLAMVGALSPWSSARMPARPCSTPSSVPKRSSSTRARPASTAPSGKGRVPPVALDSAWRQQPKSASSAATRRSASSTRCATASPGAARRARPSSTSPARRGSAAASSITTSGPRSGCWSRWSAATPSCAIARLDEMLAEAKTVDDVLDVLVASLTDMIENDPGYFLLLYELFSAGRRNPDIQHEVGQLFERTRSHVAEVLRAKEDEGVLKPPLRRRGGRLLPLRASATASPCRRSRIPSATTAPPWPPAPPRPATCSSTSSRAHFDRGVTALTPIPSM